MRIIPFRIKASKDDDNFSDVYEFLIEGSKKDAYEIEIDIDSLNDLGITDTRCTCPDHQFRGSYCKHIKECVKILGCFDIKTDSVETNSQARVEKDGHTLKDSILPDTEFKQNTNNFGGMDIGYRIVTKELGRNKDPDKCDKDCKCSFCVHKANPWVDKSINGEEIRH